jgi:hypothetical protein
VVDCLFIISYKIRRPVDKNIKIGLTMAVKSSEKLGINYTPRGFNNHY